jgi:hypothetical protein
MEGLWTAEFGSKAGIFGGGVAVFRDGKVVGGDGGYFYVGEYTLTGQTLTATLEVRPFIDNYQSVFGTVNRKFTLDLVGSLQDSDHAVAKGNARGMPELAFGVKLTKRI